MDPLIRSFNNQRETKRKKEVNVMERQTSNESTLMLHVTDVSGQKQARVPEVPVDANVADVVREIAQQMNLPNTDPSGRPIQWLARREREGERLNGSAIVREVLVNDDKIVLQPNLEAGTGSFSALKA